jgi:hypothetical protein
MLKAKVELENIVAKKSKITFFIFFSYLIPAAFNC